ncbi:MAG: 60S ribosomal protein L31 [Muribaculaceae bacterium]|nr:60S ribosomal protein L31 [Muribaculaceae bacterium]
MKKIFLAIICLTLCVGQMMANANSEKEMERLTKEFLAHYEGNLPTGTEISADSSSININFLEFIADPVAKRYFEQMGKVILAEQAADTEMNVEIEDLQLGQIMDMRESTKRGAHKAVAIPHVTCCLKIPYTYTSVDGKNNPIRLSSILYRPSPFQLNLNAELGVLNVINYRVALFAFMIELIKGAWNAVVGYTFDYGVLSCHPTVTTSAEAPSGNSPLDGDVHMFCSDYAIVVCPDYCGYGLSEFKQHPYLVQGVTARNVVDGYIAALDLIKSNNESGASGSWKLASDFYTDLIGYSQGGSVALATLRYLEGPQVSSDQLNRINLRNVYCGDGPYSPIATINQYVEWANSSEKKYNEMAYPCVLPLIVQAAKDAYDNDCMRTVELESYFTPEFISTGIVKQLDTKRVDTESLNKIIWAKGIRRIDQIMSDKMIKKVVETDDNGVTKEKIVLNTESNEYKCLVRALSYNDLSKGWTPHHPLVFMHLDGDLVVPYSNMKEVENNIGRDPKKKMIFTDPYKVKDAMSPIWHLIATVIKDCFKNPDHGSIGKFFFMAAAAGVFEDWLK